MVKYSTTAGKYDWLFALQKETQQNSLGLSVLVTVLSTRGSTPREVGAKMLVARTSCAGTIGGGHLELKVIESAQAFLATSTPEITPQPSHQFQRIPLSASLGQCCGGHVEVMFERISHKFPAWIDEAVGLLNAGQNAVMVTRLQTSVTESISLCNPGRLIVTANRVSGSLGSIGLDQSASVSAHSMLSKGTPVKLQRCNDMVFDPLTPETTEILVFGAGHVGQAIVRVLQATNCRIHWIDPREDMFSSFAPSNNVLSVVSDDPELEIDGASAGSYVLIMTHSHALDMAICERALKRTDLSFCGLIGSSTKRQRFLNHLENRGLEQEDLKRLTCPIGIDGITGKHPAEIAVATVAQLLRLIGEEERFPLDQPVKVGSTSARGEASL